MFVRCIVFTFYPILGACMCLCALLLCFVVFVSICLYLSTELVSIYNKSVTYARSFNSSFRFSVAIWMCLYYFKYIRSFSVPDNMWMYKFCLTVFSDKKKLVDDEEEKEEEKRPTIWATLTTEPPPPPPYLIPSQICLYVYMYRHT